MSGLKLQDLQGKSRDEQFAIAARYAGVSPSVFNGIWATESQRGDPRFMRSPAGARGHFGLMPQTQATWERRLGHPINPDDFTQGLLASALTLKENMGRFGNVEDALRAYNGGWDRSKWGNPETAAYAGKVLGTRLANTPRPTIQRGTRSDEATPFEEIAGVSDLSFDEVRGMSPDTLQNGLIENRPRRPAPVPKTRARREAATIAGLTEGRGIRSHQVVGDNPNRAAEAELIANERAANVAEDQANSYSFGQKFGAAFQDNTITAAILRQFDRETEEADIPWMQQYAANREELEKGYTWEEVRRLRRANSQAGFDQIVGEINETRENRRIYTAGGQGEAIGFQLATGLLDPAGWVATAGVGKAFQMAGVGGRALMLAGRPLSGVAALAGEGVVGNVGSMALLDALGQDFTTNDYAMGAGFGAVFGGVEAPFVAAGASANAAAARGSLFRREAAARDAELYAEAMRQLPAEATPEQVRLKAREIEFKQITGTVNEALAELPEDMRLMPVEGDTWLTSDPAVKAAVEKRHGLDLMSSDVERDVVTELMARAERFTEANPVAEKGTRTLLDRVGMESTGLTLLNSPNPVARAVSQLLLEGTTGAGGRRRTAAMALAVRERAYSGFLPGYDDLFQSWRKAEGIGAITSRMSNEPAARFDRAVVLELNARDRGLPSTETNQHVLAAADHMSKGFDLMRRDQQQVGTVGASRLGDNSLGYFPRRIRSDIVANLTNNQSRAVIKVLTDQLAEGDGWDRAFAQEVATRYLERGRRQAYGSYDVPMNLHSESASDMLVDTLKAMGRTELDAREMMGRFSRGGATHTKKRLQLDLNADIGDGKKLVDIVNTDVIGVYRSYARRTAGEVALAQYGIPGRNGLRVIQQALQQSGGDTMRARAKKDMEAFDQIAAEFLNTPFGDSQTLGGKHMDNVRIATSLSRLGGMGFTQFGEFGNAIGHIGIGRTFEAIGDLPRMNREIRRLVKGEKIENPILDSIDTLGGGRLGMDEYAVTRLFDTRDNSIELYGKESLNVVDRALRAGANAQASLSFHKPLVAAQTRLMAEQIIHKAFAMVRKGGDDAALDDMGINPNLRAAMARDLDKYATFDKNGKLVKWDLAASTLSPSEKVELRDAIERGASQIIQRTYVGETGKWAHSGLLKMLFQFRTFSLTSVEKQWGRNMANHGALKSFGILVAAMSFAFPIHYARMQLKMLGMNEEDRAKFAEQNLTSAALWRSTINYASASGLIGDLADVGGSFVSGWGGDNGELFADAIGARGGNQNQLLGGVVAPSLGLIQQGWEAANGDPHKALKALPFANLPYLQPLVNAIQPEVKEAKTSLEDLLN